MLFYSLVHEVVSKNNNSLLHNEIIDQSSPYSPVSPKLTLIHWCWLHLYNICMVLVLVSWQCIFSQSKLVKVLVQLPLWTADYNYAKNYNTWFKQLFGQSTWEGSDCPEYIAQLHLSGTWILAKYCLLYVYKLYRTKWMGNL